MSDAKHSDVSYETNKKRQRMHPELIYVKDDDENYNQHSSGKLYKIGTRADKRLTAARHPTC